MLVDYDRDQLHAQDVLGYVREAVWCKYSNELYDIVIKQYYG